MHYTRRRSNIAWANYGVPSYSYRFDVTVNPLPRKFRVSLSLLGRDWFYS